jgi:hypothetical protein
MDMTADNYRLHEAEQQTRLGEFLKSEHLATLEREIALARVLLETAANANNLLLVRDLLAVLGNLVKAHRAQLEKDGELLNKNAVRKLLEEIAELVTEEFNDVPDFPDRMDRVADRLSSVVTAARNETE